MHNRALHATLAAFVEEAAAQLRSEVANGAEIPFELVERGRASARLYCYRPLTGEFVRARRDALALLPSFAAAVRGLEPVAGLEGYLRARREPPPEGGRRALAEAALRAFTAAVWADASGFEWERERFDRAYADFEQVVYARTSLTTVVATVQGLALESDEVPLGDGLALMRAGAFPDTPPEAPADPDAVLAVVRAEAPRGEPAPLEEVGRRLRRLQTALRLWDDAEIALGPLAWARTDGGAWSLVPLGAGTRRLTAVSVLAPADEDPLRAFCSLVARRTPRSGELAWALRRFELGCERPTALEALTDWLLALRALLDDAPGPGPVAGRVAAICAPPGERAALAARLIQAIGLERAAIVGVARPEPPVESLVGELGGHARAILRDVLCGHLDADLRALADRIVAEEEPARPAQPAEARPA